MERNTVKLNNSLFVVTFNQYFIKLQCINFRWRSLGLVGYLVYWRIYGPLWSPSSRKRTIKLRFRSEWQNEYNPQ